MERPLALRRAAELVPASATVPAVLAAAALFAAAVYIVMGIRSFRHALCTDLEATPDIRVTGSAPTAIAVTVSGHPLRLSLLGPYLRRSSPSRITEELRRSVPPARIPPLGLVRDRLLPVLKREDALPPAAGYVGENQVLRGPFDGDVVIAYAIEGVLQVTFVTEGMRSSWGLAADALHALALANLRTKTEHLLAEIGGPREDYVALDGFDAARLLVADLLIPPGLVDPVLAIPHEHTLMIRSRSRAAALADEAGRLRHSSSLPLSQSLYRWTAAGPERVNEPAVR